MINVVVGPPCAGKSTFVEDQAERGILRVDFDAIATVLGSEEPHHSTGNVRAAAIAARAAVIDHILSDPEEEAWIIHTNPTAKQIERYTDAAATFHLIDPGEDECMKRATEDERPDHTSAAITAWYAAPPEIPTPERGTRLTHDMRIGLLAQHAARKPR